MVARSPPKLKKVATPLNHALLTETLNKVDKCLARLQELQYTANGGSKLISAVNLSPPSTRNYFRTSLRCKQESARIRNATPLKSSYGKSTTTGISGEWRRMSLPAMLLQETMEEIIETAQFARDTVASIALTNGTTAHDFKTPLSIKQNHWPKLENSELKARRNREKQTTLQSVRLNTNNSRLQPAKSHSNFKASSPLKRTTKENCQHFVANRVSPKNKLWAKKAVVFPNPMFRSSSTIPNHQKFCTKSPDITKNRQQTPHKFLVKPPGASASKFQVKIKSLPISLSPPRNLSLNGRSPKVLSTAAKLRRSFSPSRLANRLVSPLKSRKSFIEKSDGMKIMMSGLKQRPSCSTSMSFLAQRY
ncbi:putative microtubule-binding protein TANGLED [Heracleum sosnowskyi]|uniref:Microtubule-binding protein TANGLED n=1 Tax=Heracleum sosnowskyi TaxID=360622 RepID=A0AAD8HU59_9APIA|nr:putative microtubule-binding protein TANGLED [Heracleum sosnowskyi]